jgi:flotillin
MNGLAGAEFGLVLGGVALFLVIAVIVTIKNLIVIVPPNQAAVITGRKAGDKSYKTIRGGRAIRIPIIEKVDYMPLTTMPLDIRVNNAYSKGNIPLAIQAVANVKVGWTPAEIFDNAIERLLPFDREAVEAQATETLAANLRGVLATMTPEEVNEDRLKFAEKLEDEATGDLAKLGLVIDTVRIQNVSDDVDYLASVGRRKTAEVVRDAEISEAQARAETAEKSALADQQARIARAEADARAKEREAKSKQEADIAAARAEAETKREQALAERAARVARAEADAEAKESEAASRQRADVAAAQADVKVAEERNKLRVRQAELDEQADSREKSAVENARRAEAEAREKAEKVRALAEARRLEADVIAPARAQREAAEQEAQAQAAPIRERGRAEAEVLKLLYAEIEQAGDIGLHVFTLEKLPEFLRIAGETAGAIDIDRLVVMDGGDGAGAAQAMQQRPQAMMKLIEQMAGYVGIEPDTLIRTLAYRAAGGDGATGAAPPAEPARTPAAARAVAARSGNGNPEEATP